VIFLDNHDMSRIYSQLGENVARQKMALQWLLTDAVSRNLYARRSS